MRREKEATQAVKKLEADLFAERADHSRQVTTYPDSDLGSPQSSTNVGEPEVCRDSG